MLSGFRPRGMGPKAGVPGLPGEVSVGRPIRQGSGARGRRLSGSMGQVSRPMDPEPSARSRAGPSQSACVARETVPKRDCNRGLEGTVGALVTRGRGPKHELYRGRPPAPGSTSPAPVGDLESFEG